MMVHGEEREKVLATISADHGFMKEFIDDFLEDVPKDIQALEDAILARDGARLEMAAHGLKSVVGLFCAVQTYALAREMEDLAREGDFPGASVKLGELRVSIESLKQLLLSAR